MQKKYEKTTGNLLKGPRNKSEATVVFETIVKEILQKNSVISISYNLLNELELTINDYPYNLTVILQNIDFEHLNFPTTIFSDYELFIHEKLLIYKPHLASDHSMTDLSDNNNVEDKIPTLLDFKQRDPNGIFDCLSYGEKIAINIYTTAAYSQINFFLRSSGRYKNKDIPKELLPQQIKELILVSAIASCGLGKIIQINQSPDISNYSEIEQLSRKETSSRMQSILSKRKKEVKNNTVTRNESFISSSTNVDGFNDKSDVLSTIIQPCSLNPLGKKIAPLAELEKENEVLFIPGTQFKFFEYRRRHGIDYFSAIPSRSLDSIPKHRYSIKCMEIRRTLLEKKDELIQIIQQDEATKKLEKSSFFSEKFINFNFILKQIDIISSYLETGARLSSADYFKAIIDLKSVLEDMQRNDRFSYNIKLNSLVSKIEQTIQIEIDDCVQHLSKEVDPITLLSAMKKLNKKNKLIICEDETTKANIAKIKSICIEKYRDQSYYGNSSLNRKILLDPDIANLLTPQTIALIFVEHRRLKKNNKLKNLSNTCNIALLREGKKEDFFISLADAIFYGFQDGLDVIKYMPNNDKKYGKIEYEAQKQSFEMHTHKIIINLIKASLFFDVEGADDKYKLNNVYSCASLEERFASIVSTIQIIKRKNNISKLLFVEGFETQSIQNQCFKGMSQFCEFSQTKDTLIVKNNDIHTLQELAKKFTADDTLLNSIISHLFYDRVHLEAALSLDTQIDIQGKLYSFSEFFCEVIKLSTENPLVAEQFDKRFSLVEAHLEKIFPKEYTKAKLHNNQVTFKL